MGPAETGGEEEGSAVLRALFEPCDGLAGLDAVGGIGIGGTENVPVEAMAGGFGIVGTAEDFRAGWIFVELAFFLWRDRVAARRR